MKKILIAAVITVSAMLFSAGLVWAVDISFSDVKPENWYYSNVMNLADMGVISGYPDGTYKPAEPVNRAEVAAIIDRYDQKKIQNIEKELQILRTHRTEDLYDYPTWAEFRNQAGQFPAFENIPPSYNKMGFDWTIFKYGEENMDDYEIIAVDNSGQKRGGVIYEILVHKSLVENNWGIYHVRAHYSSGSYMYGPFYNDYEEMVQDITSNYYDETKSSDPESLKI